MYLDDKIIGFTRKGIIVAFILKVQKLVFSPSGITAVYSIKTTTIRAV